MQIKKQVSESLVRAVNVSVEDCVLDGERVVRIVKDKELYGDFDTNTFALLDGVSFLDGDVTVRVRARLLPDAPEYSRAFVGIVFRAADDGSEFESFYVRPTNGRLCADPVRRSHGCQYFSYPGYTFAYFRRFGITEFEAPVGIAPDEWVEIRAKVAGERAEFYLNGSDVPVLVVPHLKHGRGGHRGFGIYVDDGTEAFVSDYAIAE